MWINRKRNEKNDEKKHLTMSFMILTFFFANKWKKNTEKKIEKRNDMRKNAHLAFVISYGFSYNFCWIYLQFCLLHSFAIAAFFILVFVFSCSVHVVHLYFDECKWNWHGFWKATTSELNVASSSSPSQTNHVAT